MGHEYDRETGWAYGREQGKCKRVIQTAKSAVEGSGGCLLYILVAMMLAWNIF